VTGTKDDNTQLIMNEAQHVTPSIVAPRNVTSNSIAIASFNPKVNSMTTDRDHPVSTSMDSYLETKKIDEPVRTISSARERELLQPKSTGVTKSSTDSKPMLVSSSKDYAPSSNASNQRPEEAKTELRKSISWHASNILDLTKPTAMVDTNAVATTKGSGEQTNAFRDDDSHENDLQVIELNTEVNARRMVERSRRRSDDPEMMKNANNNPNMSSNIDSNVNHEDTSDVDAEEIEESFVPMRQSMGKEFNPKSGIGLGRKLRFLLENELGKHEPTDSNTIPTLKSKGNAFISRESSHKPTGPKKPRRSSHLKSSSSSTRHLLRPKKYGTELEADYEEKLTLSDDEQDTISEDDGYFDPSHMIHIPTGVIR
jgi:hypothetical protein